MSAPEDNPADETWDPSEAEWLDALEKRVEMRQQPAEAMRVLKAAFQADAAYAWSWHCNLACCAMDEGMDHPAANRAAARFMKLAFGVETLEKRVEALEKVVDDLVDFSQGRPTAAQPDDMPRMVVSAAKVAEIKAELERLTGLEAGLILCGANVVLEKDRVPDSELPTLMSLKGLFKERLSEAHKEAVADRAAGNYVECESLEDLARILTDDPAEIEAMTRAVTKPDAGYPTDAHLEEIDRIVAANRAKSIAAISLYGENVGLEADSPASVPQADAPARPPTALEQALKNPPPIPGVTEMRARIKARKEAAEQEADAPAIVEAPK